MSKYEDDPYSSAESWQASKIGDRFYPIIVSIIDTQTLLATSSHHKSFPLEMTIEHLIERKCISYTLTYKGARVAMWDLVEMPGCCGICISTRVLIMPEYRRKGVGTILNLMRMAIAKDLGYSLMFCTDVLENKPQQKILNKNGWKKLYEFTNRQTRNPIGIHVIDLK